jgi:hypothetical protein
MFWNEVPAEITDAERDALIESLAGNVVRRRLEMPAVFLLEAHRPLSFLASQALLLSAPLLGSFVGFREVNRFGYFLAERDNLGRLIDRIEQLARERDRHPVERAAAE